MCDPLSITMAAVGVVGGMMDSKNKGKAWAAQEETRRKQLTEALKASNIADASLKLAANESYKQARSELENNTMQAIKAKGTVTTAMGESNLEGRTMDRTMRDTENMFLKTKGQITENYERDYHNIWVQRLENNQNIIAQIQGSQPAPKPDSASQALNTVQSGVSGALVGQQLWGTYKGSPMGSGTTANKEQSSNRGK
ncbi:internal virion protein [Aeromonas phage JELG-KS1]|uniref:Internal virion protein n=1 Tax=Aeromonas phage JELG-KS1 TaxID=2951233 RepID=A0A9E7T0Y9_9CAUD|nr:internal virion protein [Aeromonas phage JELG-KS1]